MASVNALINQRLKKSDNASKMAAMAKESAKGNLSSFSGVFSVLDLNESEKGKIKSILSEFALDDAKVADDLSMIIAITSEVKAINNQAALLHGERIRKVHQILKNYRDGAFTAWLIAAYGNRQTPYNLMQYFLFCEALPKSLRPQIESMPRQAVYTLASREGPLEKKREIIEAYKGEPKDQILLRIREVFPLNSKDRRRQNLGEALLLSLKKIKGEIKHEKAALTKVQINAISALLSEIQSMIDLT